MKVLVGTPTHECKEYGVYRWLDNVRSLDTPAGYILDHIIVDNSDTPDFSKRMEHYAPEKNIIWMPGMAGKDEEERRRDSRELIREWMLADDHDLLLSWECDILVDNDALIKLVPFIEVFDTCSVAYPVRDHQDDMGGGVGFMFIKREIVERFSWLEGGGYGQCDKLNLNCHYSGDSWLMRRVQRAKYKSVETTHFVMSQHLAE